MDEGKSKKINSKDGDPNAWKGNLPLYLIFPSYSRLVTFLWSRLGLAVPINRLFGDICYKESLFGMTYILELSLGETVKGSNVIAIEKELL